MIHTIIAFNQYIVNTYYTNRYYQTFITDQEYKYNTLMSVTL